MIGRNSMLSNFVRRFATSSNCSKKALILGLKTTKQEKNESVKEKPCNPEGTSMFERLDGKWDGKLSRMLTAARPLKTGQALTFYDVGDEYQTVVVVGLGPNGNAINLAEGLDEQKENIRQAIAAGIYQLKDSGMEEVVVDPSIDCPLAAAEGAYLSSWSYKESERIKFPALCDTRGSTAGEWRCGKIYAEAQNWARFLMDSPANLMTPSLFAENVEKMFSNCDTSGLVNVKIRNQEWIQNEKMGAFLSVAQGSSEEPKLVEVHYEGPGVASDEQPLVLVGKGVTFDSGGVSIKPSQGMDEMRADMGGAATMVAAILAAARLNTKGKVIGLFPLCENLINGKATKPGDVVTARNGVTIQVDNTDAEGRLLLADTILYAQDFNPTALVDAATLTVFWGESRHDGATFDRDRSAFTLDQVAEQECFNGAIAVALGSSASGVFANNDRLWGLLNQAGTVTGDRVWRMPLFDHYTKQVSPSHLADINNVGEGGRWGGACTAAAFLKHFVKSEVPWAHMDIAGVMVSNGKDVPYLSQGMSGRPTRTIARFIKDFCESS